MAASFPPPKPVPRLSHKKELSRLSAPFVSVQAGPARSFAVAALSLAVVAAACVARLGTQPARWASLAVVLLTLSLVVAASVRQRRRLASLERWLESLVHRADPDGAARALRALGLLRRAKVDDSVGSRELAEVHASRALSRVSVDAITLLSRRRARWLSWGAAFAIVSAVVVVGSGPVRVAEGLLVGFATKGLAPVGLPYVDDLRVTVKPPDYLRQKERTLVASEDIDAPLGSALTIRGTPTLSGRALVITDLAGHEAPFVDDGAGGVAVRWALAQSVSLRVGARFGEVLILQERPIVVTAIPDLPPRVRLEGAPRSAKLVDEKEIRIAYQAEDDHGLRQVDLVLRTGGKEERRVLSKPDGDTRTDQGGYTVRADDRFVRASYLPIEITVEARDNDPITGPKWGKSDAITLVPPAIGELEAARYEALVEARDVVVDLAAELSRVDPKPRDADARVAMKTAREKVEAIMGRTFGPVSFSPKTRAFVAGQLSRLREREREKTFNVGKAREAAERAAVALDRAAGTIGAKDAASLSKRVSRVASDVADAWLAVARDVDADRARQRALAGVSVLAPSGAAIRRLSVLGSDLGEIIENGHRRITRAASSSDWLHAELAARDLFARLARPNPSFRGGSGGGRGGDASGGEPEPGDEAPGDDEEAFDAEQKALDELAREHGENQENVEKALRDAAKEAGGDELFEEAKRRAAELRDMSGRLPQPDGDDAPLDRGREAALRMADSLERGDFQDAKEAGQAADKNLGEAARDTVDKGGDDAASVIEQARQRASARAAKDGQAKLAPHVKWVEELEARLKKKLQERGQLRDSSAREGQLAEKVRELGHGARALPENTARSLRDAEARMRDAEKALKSGDTRRGRDEQEKAQRLLEQARESGTDEPKGDGDDKATKTMRDALDALAKKAKSKTDGGEEGEDGRSSMHGEVPAKDAHRGPDELRRRVQDGMRRGLTPEVRDAARRYTERLLK